ncbi:MAG: polysaccharide biosynthesis protein, partial [Bacteroidales bacterium]|nr:polysaccharide biosynthesis protein [Bacteroidales bacterium]
MRIAMILVYSAVNTRIQEKYEHERILVYGTSDKSVATIVRLQNSKHYRMIGFIERSSVRSNLLLDQFTVYNFEDDKQLPKIILDNGIDAVLFSKDTDAQAEENGLIKFCSKHGVKVLIVPTLDEVVDGQSILRPREVKVEDLLGRKEIVISLDAIKANFAGKVVMVTGAAGSIGSELVRQLATFGVKQLVLFDNAETPMHNLRLELESRFPELYFVPVIGDVRQKERVDFAFRTWHPQVVFHAAAYKHVPLMEENPCEAVLVNVYGTRNVADKCLEYGVEKMVMISTDKAVNPTNIMGCTKRLAEIYVQSLGLSVEKGEMRGKTRFVTTRFGNVLGSNGSVIPRFREQIAAGGPVTVTHPDINRFFMTIPEACRLVMEAATLSRENQIFVFDMGTPVKIADLAKR